MRREFKHILYDKMKNNPNIWVITPDLGYKFFDEIEKDFPERFVKSKASEQLAMGLAIGLYHGNKSIIPVIYSITPFLLFRPAEWIRNYLHNEQVPVKLLAAGRNDDYKHDGFSHYAGDDNLFLKQFNIKCYWPENINELNDNTESWLNYKGPSYLNLKR